MRKTHRFLIGALVLCAAGAALATPLGVCSHPVWMVDGDQDGGRFGTVAPAGDVNGDGYDDVLVGAYAYDDPELDEGKVYLYLGSANGLSPTPAWTGQCDRAGARYGDKLSGVGDVNRDGYDDVVIGAGNYTRTLTDQGAAFLYLGGPNGLSPQPDWVQEGDQEGGNFGACAQPAGDVNGDGYADIILGAWLYDSGQTDEGKAFVFLGGPNGPSHTPAWTGESNVASSAYGYFCTAAGDVNHDGFGDIVVGARRFTSNGLSSRGRAYVYYGSSTGPSLTPSWTHEGDKANDEFGNAPSTAGDVNGDGYDDVVINAFRYDIPGKQNVGAAYVFLGSATGLGANLAWFKAGDQANTYYAYHVDTAGDVNRDGYDDLLVTSSDYNVPGHPDAGRAWVYLGSATGLADTAAWIQDGDQDNCQLGNAGRGAGDVNGDGYADVVTGVLYRDIGSLADAGRAWGFYGCPDGVLGVGSGSPSGGLRLELAGRNPFTASIDLALEMPVRAPVRLSVVDLSGRSVATLLDGVSEPGRRVVRWDGRDRAGHRVGAGVYWARLDAGTQGRSVMLIRIAN